MIARVRIVMSTSNVVITLGKAISAQEVLASEHLTAKNKNVNSDYAAHQLILLSPVDAPANLAQSIVNVALKTATMDSAFHTQCLVLAATQTYIAMDKVVQYITNAMDKAAQTVNAARILTKDPTVMASHVKLVLIACLVHVLMELALANVFLRLQALIVTDSHALLIATAMVVIFALTTLVPQGLHLVALQHPILTDAME